MKENDKSKFEDSSPQSHRGNQDKQSNRHSKSDPNDTKLGKWSREEHKELLQCNFLYKLSSY